MRTVLRKLWPYLTFFLALIAGTAAQPAPAPLSAYDVDPAETSVSGLSSGGYMAVQFGIAYSASLRARIVPIRRRVNMPRATRA